MGLGLTNRKPGQLFTDGESTEPAYEFVGISDFYDERKPNHPLSGSEEAIKDEHIPSEEEIKWIPQKKLRNMSSYAVVHFRRIDDNSDVYFGKRFTPSAKRWGNTEPGYFSYLSKLTIKQGANLNPTDIMKKRGPLSVEDIVRDVSFAFTDKPKFQQLLPQLVEDTERDGYPSEKEGYSVDGINDGEVDSITNYFCEILHPIALIKGIYEGNAKEGITVFFGKKVDYTEVLIEFPDSKTHGLYDSVLKYKGKKLFVSSKYGNSTSAAKPSISNLLDLYNKYDDKSMFEGYEKEIQIIEYINTFSGREGPVMIAKDIYDLVDEKDYDILKNMDRIYRDHSIQNKNEAYNELELTENLIRFYDVIQSANHEREDKFIHIISGIAKVVAEVVNKPEEGKEDSKFSEFATKLLNGSVVQVYTRAKKKNNRLYFSKFETQWPDDSATTVFLDSATRYRTNAVTGKLGFVIKYKDSSKKDLIEELIVEDEHHYNKIPYLDLNVESWGIITYDGKILDGDSVPKATEHGDLIDHYNLPDDFGSRYIIFTEKNNPGLTMQVSCYGPKIKNKVHFSALLNAMERKLPLVDDLDFEMINRDGKNLRLKGSFKDIMLKLRPLLK